MGMGAGRARLAFALALAVGALAAPATAHAAGGDAAATQRYLAENLKLVRIAVAHIPAAKAAIDGVLSHVRSHCPGAAAESPQDPESTQLSNEVIGAMVTSALHVDLPDLRKFVRVDTGLRWSSSGLTRTVREYVSKVATMGGLAIPDVCADVRAWAASGFRTLPAATLSFSPRFMESWVALGEVPAGLSRFISGGQRGLVNAASRLESQLSEFEANEVENWGRIMNTLGLHP
jgi:hypothetical protein